MNLSFPRPSTMNPPDKYDLDEQMILRENPDEDTFRRRVSIHWQDITPLFQFLKPYETKERDTYSGKPCGCPTMVKAGVKYSAWSKELTDIVQLMPIPDDSDEITPEQLTSFKVIQRLADVLYSRVQKPEDETD